LPDDPFFHFRIPHNIVGKKKFAFIKKKSLDFHNDSSYNLS